MLVSFQPLGRADKNRAKQAHIAVCAGRDIQRLHDIIGDWLTRMDIFNIEYRCNRRPFDFFTRIGSSFAD